MKMVHVTIHTADFEDELKFYQDIVGLSIQRDLRPQGRKLVFLAEAEGDTCIELIEHPNGEKVASSYLSIGFHTENVEQKREELAARGYEVTPLLQPSPQVKFFYVTDPAGVRIQFI